MKRLLIRSITTAFSRPLNDLLGQRGGPVTVRFDKPWLYPYDLEQGKFDTSANVFDPAKQQIFRYRSLQQILT